MPDFMPTSPVLSIANPVIWLELFTAHLSWDFNRNVWARVRCMDDSVYDDIFPDINAVRGLLLEIGVRF